MPRETAPLRIRIGPLLVLAWLALASGCASSPPTRYYLLQPAGFAAAAAHTEAALGIGPVKLPAYLDRNEIVVEQTDFEVTLSDYSQWAEPLDDNIANVLAANLADLLGTDRISRYPRPPGTPVDYQVELDIGRFNARADGRVVLETRWRLLDGDRRPLQVRSARLSEPFTGEDMEAVVAAHSRILTWLSQAIAAALRARIDSD